MVAPPSPPPPLHQPAQSHSTSLSPNLGALSPRTPDDAIFTQRRPGGSGNSGRSVSSMRRRVASGAAAAFSRSIDDEGAAPHGRVLLPAPVEPRTEAEATPISSLPGFSEAVNGARKPSALQIGAAFGQRVRSLAVGWTAGAGTEAATTQPATGATGWLRGRLSSNNLAGGSGGAQRDAALLPPISLDSQSSFGTLRDTGATHVASAASKRSFVNDEKDEPDYSDDEGEPQDSIRVIQAGNIMMEQSVYADPADWTSPPRFAASKHSSYVAPEGSDIGVTRMDQSPSQSYVEPRAFADGASQLTRRESRFKEVWTPDTVPRSALSATSTASLSQANIARATLSPHSRANSFITAPVTSGSVAGTSTYSLVAPSTASTALAEMGASLRWSQKFPEGTHMSRARSSRLSVAGLAGGLPAARMSGIWSEKEKEKAYGDDGLQIPTLTYNDAGSDDYTDDGKPSRRGSIMRSLGRRRSNTSRIQSAETRNALRFLAKRREEVDDDSSPDGQARAAGVGAPLCQEEERVAKWNTFKWVLFISILVLFCYGVAGLVGTLLTWARSWERADVSIVVDTDILIFLTLASFLCVLTAVVGLSGAILNSRPILSLYAFLLWPTLLSILVVGYSAYKRENLRLDRKLNMAWSRYFDDLDRLRLQNNLKCCGFYTPLHQATFSRTCYPRTALPGCKGKLYRYERTALRRLYTCVFSIVFVHLANISVSLLCSNHVNATFGKGLTPRAYRLDMTHVRRNALGIMRALRAAQEHVDVAKATSDSGLLRPPNAAAALDAQHHRGMHDEKHMADASFTSVELDESHRAHQPQGLVARSLAALRPFHDRPELPPKSPRRLETYAFTTPQAAIASNDVRGLGFVVSLNHGQARVLQDQHLGRASH